MAKRSSKSGVRHALRQSGLHALLARVRDGLANARLAEAAHMRDLRSEAQRVCGAAWHTIALRWPPLAELVRERKRGLRTRYRPPPTAAELTSPLSVDAVDALIAQLMASSSWQARAAAALGLAHVPADGVVQALVRALRDPSQEVAVAAVDALAHHDEVLAEGELLAVLDNRDGYFSAVTRVAAISALSRRLELVHFGPVFAALRDIDAEVSIAAVALIAERMPGAAGNYLLPLLRDQSGYYLPVVRLAAANAL